jgi:tetratricopeptide (TPR) repeat protein
MLTPSQMLMQLDARFDFLVSRRRDIAPRHRTLRAAFGWSYELLSPELRRFFARLSVFQGQWTLEAAEQVCGDSGVQVFGYSGVQEVGPELPNPPSTTHSVGTRGAPGTPESPIPALDHLTELRERSLILVTEGDEEEMGYRMLETLREFAAEHLAPEEQAALRRRHAEYYLEQAEQAAPHLHGPEQSVWLDRLDAEHDNFRAVLAWGLGSDEAPRSGEGEAEEKLPRSPAQIALRLAERLHFFWNVRGHVAEGRRWLDDLLATTSGREPTPLRAAALYGAAVLATTQHDFHAACALYEESLSNRQMLGDATRIADILCQWGYAAAQMGERAVARTLFDESREVCRQTDYPGGLAHVLKCTGEIALAEGDGEQAGVAFEESLALYRELGDTRGVAMMLGEMAHLLLSQGEDERAAPFLAEHVELSRHLKDRGHMALALRNLGYVARHRGEHGTARQLFTECLALWRELGERSQTVELLACLCSAAWHEGGPEAARAFGADCLSLLRGVSDPPVVAACLELLTEAAVRQEQEVGLSAETARGVARLLAMTARLRETKDSSWWWPAERAASDRCSAAARAALGEQAFAAACAEGRAMSVDQALDELRHLGLRSPDR